MKSYMVKIAINRACLSLLLIF